jgi:hypothetical protein
MAKKAKLNFADDSEMSEMAKKYMRMLREYEEQVDDDKDSAGSARH